MPCLVLLDICIVSLLHELWILIPSCCTILMSHQLLMAILFTVYSQNIWTPIFMHRQCILEVLWYCLFPCLPCNIKVPQSSLFLKKILKFMVKHFYYFSICSFVCFYVWPWQEVIYNAIFISGYWIRFEILFVLHFSSMVLALIIPHLSGPSIVLHLPLSMYSSSVSDIPKKAVPFPGTRKNLHARCLLPCVICTLHITNLGIFILSYVANITLLPMFLFNWSNVLGNRIWKMSNGINLPSLPVCILQSILYLLHLLLVSNLVIVSILSQLKLKDFIVTTSMLLSCSIFMLCLAISMPWCILCTALLLMFVYMFCQMQGVV